MANKTIGQLTSASTITLDEQTTVIPIFQAEQAGSENGITYKADFEQIIDNFDLVQNGSTTAPVNDGDVANKKYVDDRETAINIKIANDINQASTAINNNINTAINGLPFWTLSEAHTCKGRYYFELNVSSSVLYNAGKIILYYMPPYSDGTFNIDGTWYLTAKDETLRSFLNRGSSPDILITNASEHTQVILELAATNWQRESPFAPDPGYPGSVWYYPVSYSEDPLEKNTTYYISGALGSLNFLQQNYIYKSDYYDGKQLSLNAVPYATKDLPGGIKISDGLSINAWGECSVNIGNGLSINSSNQIQSLLQYNYYKEEIQSAAGTTNTWTAIDDDTFSLSSKTIFIGNLSQTYSSGFPAGIGISESTAQTLGKSYQVPSGTYSTSRIDRANSLSVILINTTNNTKYYQAWTKRGTATDSGHPNKYTLEGITFNLSSFTF